MQIIVRSPNQFVRYLDIKLHYENSMYVTILKSFCTPNNTYFYFNVGLDSCFYVKSYTMVYGMIVYYLDISV